MTKQKKSIRLTNAVRDKILHDLLVRGFEKEGDNIKKRRYALSRKVYNDVYSAKERKQMLDMPNGWLPKVKTLRVQFGGSSGDVCQREFAEGDEVLIPYKDMGHYGSTNILKVYDHQHKLTEEHEKITDDIEYHKSRYKTAKVEARAVLYSANTTRALKESWPQIASIVEKYEPSEGSQNGTSIIPVTNSLNKKLGLA